MIILRIIDFIPRMPNVLISSGFFISLRRREDGRSISPACVMSSRVSGVFSASIAVSISFAVSVRRRLSALRPRSSSLPKSAFQRFSYVESEASDRSPDSQAATATDAAWRAERSPVYTPPPDVGFGKPAASPANIQPAP